jgi:hypothetical protein
MPSSDKLISSAIDKLSVHVRGILDQMKKTNSPTNNVYVTVDSDTIMKAVDEAIAKLGPQTINIQQDIHTPQALSASEVYNKSKNLLAQTKEKLTSDPVEDLTEAIRLTVEYIGNDRLPALEGWSWFDALTKYAPEKAFAFKDSPIHFVPEITHLAFFGVNANDVYPACWSRPAQETLMTITTDRRRIDCPDCLLRIETKRPPHPSL